jgi:hypothetical protein
MLHPNGHAYGCVDDSMDNRGPPLCLTSQEFYETEPSRDFVRGYTLQFGLGLPPILETIVLTAMRAEVARTSPNCAPPYSAAPKARWVSYQN